MKRNLFLYCAVVCAAATLAMTIGCDRPTAQSSAANPAGSTTVVNSVDSTSQQNASEIESLKADVKRLETKLSAVQSLAASSETHYQDVRKQIDSIVQKSDATLEAKLAESERQITALETALAEKNSINDGAISQATPVTTTTENKTAKVANSPPVSTKILSWNVESDGANPQVIAKHLQEFKGYDIYALTEVLPEAFGEFARAVGSDFDSIESRSGNSDRMQILYNQKKFELVRQLELDKINYLGRYRSPLVIHLRDKKNQAEVLVMVNHLARGKAEVRNEQAKQLVAWARDQNLPILAVGDYNYDYVFADKNGNQGFREMLRDNVWTWIEPSELIDSNWFDNPERPDGKDDYPGSILDFAFAAGSAKTWGLVCNVIVREGDFPDNDQTSDHRPFELLVNQQ